MVWGLELDKQALIEISLNFAYLTIDYRFVVWEGDARIEMVSSQERIEVPAKFRLDPTFR